MRRAVLLVLAFFAVAVPAAAAPTFPPLSGRVVDAADIIPDDAETALSVRLAQLETKTGDQMVVVTLPSLQGYDIADYGYQLGRHWQIGQKDRNNGVLLIVAPSERAVRFEVGYGLEGTLTDALTRVIIENAILPRFRADDYPGGIARGVEDAILVMEGNGEAIAEQAKKRPADDGTVLPLLPVLLIIAFIILSIYLDDGRGGRGRRRGGVLGGLGGSSWSSGGRGGGFGGGGFSGGGGSFGGGGSSGRW